MTGSQLISDATIATTRGDRSWPSTRVLVIGWIISGVALFMFVGVNPVQRTQEARVAETARQMLGRAPHDWLIPILNSEPRLQKPPLMYWLSAISYAIGGVSEFTARVPIVIIGWLTIGVTYLTGRTLFGRRAGFLGAAALASSYLFFRHMRLAETDGPATLGVTLALFGMLRGVAGEMWRGRLAHVSDSQDVGGAPTPPGEAPSAIWFHLAAIGIAFAIFSKGMPGLFPCLFLVAWVIVERRWDVLKRFILCGAPLTAIVLAAPWYLYVIHDVGREKLIYELNAVTVGEDHAGWFFQYFPLLFVATAPWSGFMPFAIYESARRWKPDSRMRAMLLWILSIFVPLCITGNKQVHYLLPLMPPIMILIGWMIDEGCRADADRKFARGVRWLTLGTIVGATIAGVGLLVGARIETGRITPVDVMIALAVIVTTSAVWALYRRGVIAMVTGLSLAWMGIFPILMSLCFPRFEPSDAGFVASAVEKKFGKDATLCYWGTHSSLSLCFALRKEIRQIPTAEDLNAALRADPNLIVITQSKLKSPTTGPAEPFENVYAITTLNQKYDFYVARATRP